MPTNAELHTPPPKSWEEFEEITCSAAKNRWNNPDFTRHGRQGQRQDGVDIYGVDDKGELVGIQCKNTWGGIKLKTITDEVVKADSFQPCLKRLYVATTSDTDHDLQESVRELSDGRTAQGKFAVAILFWNDVWQDLTRDESRLFQHYPQLRPKGNEPSHDQRLFKDFQTIFPYDPCVRLLDQHDFGGPFVKAAIQPLYDFYGTWNQPEKEFLDKELKAALEGLFRAAETLANHLVEKTVPVGNQTFCSVFSDNQRAEGPRPPHVIEDASILNEEATKFVPVYNSFVRLCKQKLER